MLPPRHGYGGDTWERNIRRSVEQGRQSKVPPDMKTGLVCPGALQMFPKYARAYNAACFGQQTVGYGVYAFARR